MKTQTRTSGRAHDLQATLLLVSAILICSVFWLAVIKVLFVETSVLFDVSFAAGMGVFLSGFLCVFKANELED